MTPRCVYRLAISFAVFFAVFFAVSAWFLGGKLGLLAPRGFVPPLVVRSTAPAEGKASHIFCD